MEIDAINWTRRLNLPARFLQYFLYRVGVSLLFFSVSFRQAGVFSIFARVRWIVRALLEGNDQTVEGWRPWRIGGRLFDIRHYVKLMVQRKWSAILMVSTIVGRWEVWQWRFGVKIRAYEAFCKIRKSVVLVNGLVLVGYQIHVAVGNERASDPDPAKLRCFAEFGLLS